MKSHRLWLFIVPLAVAFFVTELQWARAIVWDEVEFFRATKWVAEGRVPFRDFWEHHLPLQWYLFAPLAALFDGAGVAPLLAMRWVQLPLWIAVLACLSAIAARAGVSATLAPAVLAVSSVFLVESAVEYRVDAPAAACYFGALLLAIARPRSARAWIAFGALMSAAVLSNMRLMPLVIVTALLMLAARFDERRWGWNSRALWMGGGVAIAGAVFAAWAFGTGSFDELRAAMQQNVLFVRMTGEAGTLGPLLLQPFTRPDFGTIALMLGGVAGLFFALREIRRPGILQLIALLAIASIVIVARQGVQYAYHFQMTLLLLAVLTASVLRSERVQRLSVVIAGAILLFNLVRLFPLGESMPYKDAVMKEADRRTLPNERVWDGAGYALRREPAYRYWFLPALVRMLAERGLVEPYDAPQLAAAPPAAIVHSVRVSLWLRSFPAAREYVTHHYIPLYRDLWIPGLNGVIRPNQEATWVTPRAGRYRVYASELLAKHPWFTAPLNYAVYDEEDAPIFQVRLRDLPPADPRLMNLTVDGAPVAGALVLARGSVVRLRAGWPRPVAVVIVPEDVSTLFICPPRPGVM